MSNLDTAPWWQRAVIYQIYPRSFQDSNGDGIGDLVGITRRLDYLAQTLGVQAIWLSPFYPSPMADFGYDVADYCDVAPCFGDLDAFDRLVQACRQRELKLIIDFVPNHSSDQHPWFIASRADRAAERRDWYVWADPGPGGAPPNNWLSVFGGPAWTLDEATGQYYLHSFLPQQPDLNWRNPQLRRAMLQALRFWLDRGVDGFRIDVAHYVMKDPQLRDNPPAPPGHQHQHKPMGAYDAQLHVHDMGHPDAHDVYREVRSLLESYGLDPAEQRMAVGEIHIFERARWAAYYGAPGRLDELHLPFNFDLLAVPFSAEAVRASVDGLEAALPAGAWPNYVLGNHDDPRLAGRLGRQNARLAAMLLLTLRGTPTLYYGDELGLEDVPIAPGEQQDPAGRDDPSLGRDPCRTPMPWTEATNAGFTEPGVRPWLPLGADRAGRSVAQQLKDQRSILQLYRRLLELRAGSPALQLGDYAPVETPETPGCYLYSRTLGDEELLVALNFADHAQEITLPGPSGRLLLSTELDREPEDLRQPLRLRAHEGIVIAASTASH